MSLNISLSVSKLNVGYGGGIGMDWYKEYIEAGIRKEVKLLRDNGFNTICSCEHEKYIQCDFIPEGNIYRLDKLLFDKGYRDYHITIHIERVKGCSNSFLQVDFK